MLLSMLVGAIVFMPVMVFVALEARWRHRWPERFVHHREADDVGNGAYRQGTVKDTWTETLHGSAPVGVRVAALTCFFEGMSLVVSAPVWAIGVMVALDKSPVPFWLAMLVATFVPGALSAVMMSRAGVALLGGDHATADRATARATAFALTLNAVLIGVSAIAMVLMRNRDSEGLVVPLCYAPVSIAQAIFTRAMFKKHERHFDGAMRAEVEGEPTHAAPESVGLEA